VNTKKNEFIGLKKYTHAQRVVIIDNLIIPRLKAELGNNLIAIAADGSFARNDDTDYSDIELVVFVKNATHLPRGIGKIHEGVLIDIAFVTENDYYKHVLEPNPHWFLSGSDTLLPLVNSRFIKNVQRYRVKKLSQKCLRCARKQLFEVQESFGKLFTAIQTQNTENLVPVLADATMQTLKLLAFMNAKPYTTLGSFITQARGFPIKPDGFDEFIDLIVNARFLDLKNLNARARTLFTGIERYFNEKIGKNIYDGNLSQLITMN
jgi:predicted nucleotidyltransferase